MKPIHIFKFLAFGLLTFAVLGSSPAVPGASINLAPISYVTMAGRTSGQVTNMAVMDQTKSEDDPDLYVSLITSGSDYRGFRRYQLPNNIARNSITNLQVKVNYKGWAASNQKWTWMMYDWVIKRWIVVGTNSAASYNIWRLLIFTPRSPQHFVNHATHKILVFVGSNNPSGDAKLDYEAVFVGYNSAIAPDAGEGEENTDLESIPTPPFP